MLLDFLSPFSQNDNSLNKRRDSLLYWLFLVVATFAWWLISVSLYFGNRYGVFATRGLAKGLLLLPVIFVCAIFIAKLFVLPKSSQISQKDRRSLIATCAALSLLLLVLFPFPVPALQQQHTLQIMSTGQRNSASQGALVEIREFSFLDGTPVPINEFILGGDWQIIGETLLSTGEQSSSLAEWSGKMPAGMVLNIRHNIDAGNVSITWDRDQTDYDLYAPKSITTNLVLRAGQGASLNQSLMLALVQLTFFIGLFAFLYLIGLAVELKWPSPALVYAFLGFVYALIMVFFVANKLSYAEFSAIRVYRDTISYAETAGKSWNSMRFWAGTRPFTYPLVLKLFGIHAENYSDALRNADVTQFQYWFSIVSWTALGAALSLRVRTLWLKPFAFGLILFFSLNLEASIWESLILAESVSFSLFALMLALWLWWDYPADNLRKSLGRSIHLLLLIVVTIFYIFTRESNQYFAIFGALVFPLAGLMRKASQQRRKDYFVYLLLFIVLVITKNIAFNVSNLWQIHIYDHLALRLLPDSEAREYFEAAGLPIDENLMQITDMTGSEYQDYLTNNSDMSAVREWINQSAVTTYMKFLISRPISSMLEPFRQLPSLLGGDNLEYHAPRYGVPTIPYWLTNLTNKVYPRAVFALWSILGLSTLGVIWYLSTNLQQSAWLVVGILLVSLYPLLFIVWHGNPMEIERHAAQVGIQYRLMGWMAVVLLLDHLSLGEISKFGKK